jgi:hypothetical protein
MLLGAGLSACANTPAPEGSTMSDGTTAFTVACEDGWDDCYTAARKICGDADFEELDRVADGSVTSAGYLARMHSVEGGIENHVYSERPRDEVFSRVLTIRCKSPE